MEIVSLNFLLFTLAVIAVYFTLSRRAQNIWLMLASAFFIGTHGWQNLLPLAVISAVTWFTGKQLYETGNRRWLTTGIAVNAGSLLFLRAAASPLVNPAGTVDHLLVPLGFSFYALQAISYLLDVFHGKIPAQAGFLDLTLYLMFFPKMLSGPIERAGHFLPQLNSDRIVDNRKAARGFTYIMFGLIRKVALAEVLLTLIPKNFILTPIIDVPLAVGLSPLHVATYVTPVSNVDRLLGLICYGIYLYNDFAGYTLIMRGISQLMGFDLSPNFREPFFSTTLSEFWSRWHISLSSWLRDYLYYPLTRCLRKQHGSRFLAVTVAVPLIITMLTAGVWHGLTIPFLVWGLVYGVIMTLEKLAFQKWPALRPQCRSRSYRAIAGLVTFCIVSLAWVPFAASSWREIAAFPVFLTQLSLWAIKPSFSLWAVILAASSFFLDIVQSTYRDSISEIPIPLHIRAAVLAAAVIVLFLAFTWTSPYTSNVFIYQAF
jgi:D-alanyl-lipoteichoic acid acyltransferase DltB (MBOAT superfamily)